MAVQRGLDISAVCSRALETELMLSSPVGQRTEKMPSTPVVIAPETYAEPGRRDRSNAAAPRKVVNAEDPRAVLALMEPEVMEPQVKTESPGRDPAPCQEPAALPSQREGADAGKAKRRGGGPGKTPADARKADWIKDFVTAKMIRDDNPDASIPKDALYQLFSRWCSDQKAKTVPDKRSFAVAVKNRFAIQEKSIGGIRCWVGIRTR